MFDVVTPRPHARNYVDSERINDEIKEARRRHPDQQQRYLARCLYLGGLSSCGAAVHAAATCGALSESAIYARLRRIDAAQADAVA